MAVEAQLDTLEAKGLITIAAYRPELEYLFRHWLVQDAAYESLLKQERRQLHRLVGEAIETLYPERRDELAAILAMHFEQSGDAERALGYLVAAGHYALDRNAIREAHSAFGRAAALLPPPDADEPDELRRRRVEIGLGQVRAGFSFRPPDELIADLEASLPDAERLGDRELEAQVHLHLALARLGTGLPPSDPAVSPSLDRVAAIGDQLADPSLAALPIALIGMNQVIKGPIRDGVEKLEAAVPLLERREDFVGSAFARGVLAIGYATLGDFDQAEAASRNATELAARGDVIAQLDAVIAESWVRSARGQLDQAVPLAQSCVVRAEETGATACLVASSWLLGDAYQRQGRFGEAKMALERGRDIARVVDRQLWRPTLQAWLGVAVASLGDDTSRFEWDEALETARSIGNRIGEAGILWKHAEAAARRGDDEAALLDFAAAAAIAEELGARPYLARILRGWGEALARLGAREKGMERLRRAAALFAEMGIEREAEEVRALLAAPAAQPAPPAAS